MIVHEKTPQRTGSLPTYTGWSRPRRLEKRPSTIVDTILRAFRIRSKTVDREWIFHQWVLKTLLDALKDWEETPSTTLYDQLLPVDVCFLQSTCDRMRDVYRQANIHELLRQLGIWLNERVVEFRHSQRVLNEEFPQIDIAVRCILGGSEAPQGLFANLYFPSFRMRGFFRKRMEKWNLMDQVVEKKPFWIRFPDHHIPIGTRDLHFFIHPESDTYPNPGAIMNIKPGRAQIFPDRLLKPEMFPLVDYPHASLVLLHYPTDQATLLYIRNVGRHETWVYQDPRWEMVPRNGWVPVFPENRVVFGRIVPTKFGTQEDQQWVVPGSLIAKVTKAS